MSRLPHRVLSILACAVILSATWLVMQPKVSALARPFDSKQETIINRSNPTRVPTQLALSECLRKFNNCKAACGSPDRDPIGTLRCIRACQLAYPCAKEGPAR